MPTETLRERVRERLAEIIDPAAITPRDRIVLYGAVAQSAARKWQTALDRADAILREFRLQPVAVGKVTGEGEVEGL